MKLLQLINPEQVSEEEAQSYQVREAARAIVVDVENNIALLYLSKFHYYKLPGGGIEVKENRNSALKRECLEEIGCDIEVISDIGMITEYRKYCLLKQISYCYFARLVGHKKEPHFEPYEIEEGSEVHWIPYMETVNLLRQCHPIGIEGQSYIVPRDIVFIKESLKLI